ncbi:alpha/beta hydrolase [Membranicola marinus]|uniref:Alpha/beta hydrolase n=1 Tax=Membranihabitans marinus TaxID=1227546 RepID=A0A953L8V4_9BACT|nr:alpha/beta hydrolase [Membranihabitans marinus]MBY5958140.1 alpha/beta hydrolase [Membranihabitans marinus]
MNALTIQTKDKFNFIGVGPDDGEVLLLLHGLFGTASNFDETIHFFKDRYRIYLPILPIFDMDVRKLSVYSLMEYVRSFVEHFDIKNPHIIGNSLGGHIALLYVLEYMDDVKSMTLTGSSGLYESAFGKSFPRRGDKDFIRKKINLTFYDDDVATEEMVDEIYDITSNTRKCLKMVKTAKSAIRHNVGDQLDKIKVPTLLVWGKQDTITPAFVAEEFNEKIPNAKLEFIDKCGHAPMLETPEAFNKVLESFLSQV